MLSDRTLEVTFLFKLIWITDLHFSHDGMVLGCNPRQRLGRAIDHINTHHGDAGACVITGDMVEQATTENYQAVSRELSRLSIPYFPMVGNHDDRDLLRQHLPLPSTCMKNFIQFSHETDVGRLICLDTLVNGASHGLLCPERLEWLSQALHRTRLRQAWYLCTIRQCAWGCRCWTPTICKMAMTFWHE